MDTVRISKVKGHADEALVRAAWARDLDSVKTTPHKTIFAV